MSLAQAVPALQQRHQVTPGLCLEHPNDAHFDGECLIHLDELQDFATATAVRYGLLGEDENAPGWPD